MADKYIIKKIVIFYPHIGEYGGIERNIIGLAASIISKGHQPILLCYYDTINISSYAGFDIPTITLADDWNPFVKSYRLRQWVSQNRNNIHECLFVFGAKAGYYAGLAFLSNYALHYTDPPSLLLPTNTTKAGGISLIKILRGKVSDAIIALGVKRALLCLTMTQENAKELEAIYKRPFNVVYQGGIQPPSNVVFSKKCVNDKLVLFSICRISNSKNLDWIIEAINVLVHDVTIQSWYKHIEVIIAGKGPDKNRLENLVKHYHLEHVVYFPGFLDSDEVEAAYAKADLFLVPGKQGYGLPILEALYRGLPVVINVASRVSEILESNDWVAISSDNSSSFTTQLLNYIKTIREKQPNPSLIEHLPTEEKWAFEIGRLCGWW